MMDFYSPGGLGIFDIGPFRVYICLLEHEPYDDGEFYGVKIYDETHCYDILHNPHMGPRLLITHRHEYGHLRDMPFHLGTAAFLPADVGVERR